MTQRKNTSLAIGAFIVGAILLVFIALLFFSGGRLFADKERVVMHFEGSVQGLQIGAPVKLKGVVLGEIADIELYFEKDNQTVITAVTADLIMERINSISGSISGNFLTDAIDNGLRAQLNYQSLLTGLLYVELDFYPDTPLHLYGFQDAHIEIPTRATSLEEITRSIQELDLKGLVDNLNNLTTQLGALVSDGNIQQTVDNFNRVALSIERTSDTMNRELNGLSTHVQGTLTEMDVLLKELNKHAPELAQSFQDSLDELNRGLDSFTEATNSIQSITSEDSPLVNQLHDTLMDISRSAQAFRSMSETLDQQPEAILRGRRAAPAGDE
jgi:paraquat-inducible protein B